MAAGKKVLAEKKALKQLLVRATPLVYKTKTKAMTLFFYVPLLLPTGYNHDIASVGGSIATNVYSTFLKGWVSKLGSKGFNQIRKTIGHNGVSLAGNEENSADGTAQNSPVSTELADNQVCQLTAARKHTGEQATVQKLPADNSETQDEIAKLIQSAQLLAKKDGRLGEPCAPRLPLTAISNCP